LTLAIPTRPVKAPTQTSLVLASLRVCFVVLGLTGLVSSASAAGARPGHSHPDPFREYVASLWPLADQRGVSRLTFDAAFAGVSFDPKVVAMTEAQPEVVRPFWDYVVSAVSAGRIERGRARAGGVSIWLAKAKQTYGVDEAVIMGVWGLETDFGDDAGSNSVIRALASLAYVHFRGDYFRAELLSALTILEHGDIPPAVMLGSWAGAMGQTQFMPSSYLAYAVDFEGHGRRDIWKSEADAIGSTANYLAQHGWTKDLPWGFEVRLPSGFALTEADSTLPAAFSSFAGRGAERADGKPWPEKGEGRLLIPAGLKGPAFLITGNFDVIKTYNNSTAYALSVALLGDAVQGGGGLVARWPTEDRPLTAVQTKRLQAALKKMGYDVGEIDGRSGDSLRSAVRAYQQRNGVPPDGYADLALLTRVSAARRLCLPAARLFACGRHARRRQSAFGLPRRPPGGVRWRYREQLTMPDQNGNGAEAPPTGPKFSVLAQYTKDLSFENPNAPRTLQGQQTAPNISIQINVNARQLAPSDFEVSLVLEGGAGQGADTMFKFELNYAGVFRVENFAPEQVQPVIMIEGPRLLFPFARQIIADAVRGGSYPPLYIDPIDFHALYLQRLAASGGQQQQRTA
jgi:membrane-bound lytic murein transglycosylase B